MIRTSVMNESSHVYFFKHLSKIKLVKLIGKLADIYLFKVKNGNTRTISEICSMSTTIMTPK